MLVIDAPGVTTARRRGAHSNRTYCQARVGGVQAKPGQPPPVQRTGKVIIRANCSSRCIIASIL